MPHSIQYDDRKGAAVAELAVCLPVLLVLVLGAIECTSMIFLDQSLNVVAYEGVRTAILNSGTTEQARERMQEVIAERKLVGCRLTFDPADVTRLPAGTPVTVTASAPCAANAPLKLRFFQDSMEAKAVMFKE